MLYSLTDRLKFAENPQIEIKGKMLTVNADATTVLALMDVVQNASEIDAARSAAEMLFSKKDRDVISALKLNIEDYITLMSTAVTLAVGGNPDAVEAQGE